MSGSSNSSRDSRRIAPLRLRVSLCAFSVLVAGCASAPPRNDPSEADYQRYWQCTYAAAMPYVSARHMPARQAAMRAQVQCYPSYLAYRDARVRHVRSLVPARDSQMAITLATQAALERRKAVTRRLTELVAEAR